MSVVATPKVVLLFAVWRRASLSADSIHLRCIKRIIFICSLLAVFAKERVHVNAYFQFFHWMIKMLPGFAVVIEQRLEAHRLAAYDSKDNRQSMLRCPHYRLR